MEKNLEITDFRCDDDLSQYTDSLLFDSDTDIAGISVTDGKIVIKADLMVRGERTLSLVDNEDLYTEEELLRNEEKRLYDPTHKLLDEFVELIKNKDDERLLISDNNWFEVMYSIYEDGDEDEDYAFDDGEVFDYDDLSEFTPDTLKEALFEEVKSIYEWHIENKKENGEVEKE